MWLLQWSSVGPPTPLQSQQSVWGELKPTTGSLPPLTGTASPVRGTHRASYLECGWSEEEGEGAFRGFGNGDGFPWKHQGRERTREPLSHVAITGAGQLVIYLEWNAENIWIHCNILVSAVRNTVSFINCEYLFIVFFKYIVVFERYVSLAIINYLNMCYKKLCHEQCKLTNCTKSLNVSHLVCYIGPGLSDLNDLYHSF